MGSMRIRIMVRVWLWARVYVRDSQWPTPLSNWGITHFLVTIFIILYIVCHLFIHIFIPSHSIPFPVLFCSEVSICIPTYVANALALQITAYPMTATLSMSTLPEPMVFWGEACVMQPGNGRRRPSPSPWKIHAPPLTPAHLRASVGLGLQSNVGPSGCALI